MEDRRISILPASPRENRDEAFKQMAASDDALLIDDHELTRSWDGEEWEWSSKGSTST